MMPVPSQEYDSCYPFIWAFDFAIWLGTFQFEIKLNFAFFGYFTFPIVML